MEGCVGLTSELTQEDVISLWRSARSWKKNGRFFTASLPQGLAQEKDWNQILNSILFKILTEKTERLDSPINYFWDRSVWEEIRICLLRRRNGYWRQNPPKWKKQLTSTKTLANTWSQHLEDKIHFEENEAQWINNLTWEDHSAADNNC